MIGILTNYRNFYIGIYSLLDGCYYALYIFKYMLICMKIFLVESLMNSRGKEGKVRETKR